MIQTCKLSCFIVIALNSRTTDNIATSRLCFNVCWYKELLPRGIKNSKKLKFGMEALFNKSRSTS